MHRQVADDAVDLHDLHLDLATEGLATGLQNGVDVMALAASVAMTSTVDQLSLLVCVDLQNGHGVVL